MTDCHDGAYIQLLFVKAKIAPKIDLSLGITFRLDSTLEEEEFKDVALEMRKHNGWEVGTDSCDGKGGL